MDAQNYAFMKKHNQKILCACVFAWWIVYTYL